MLPRAWLRNYVPAVIIGAILGLAIGFAVYQLSGGTYNIVGYVLEFHRSRDALFWILGGVFVAGAVAFLAAPNVK